MSYTKHLSIVVSSLLLSLTCVAQEYVPGEVIVKFKKEQQGKASFASKAVTSSVNLKKSWDVMNLHQFQAKPGASQDVKALVKQMKADPNVEFAEPNYIVKKQSTGFEGQPLTKSQIQSERGGSGQQKMSMAGDQSAMSGDYYQSDAPIQVDEAWNILTPGRTYQPVVAIIDTGVDYTHEVFTAANAIWRNPNEISGNGIDDDHNGYIDDVRGWNFAGNNNNPMDDEDHGTHVAGIVLGITQDIFATTISPSKIKIMPLKFLDSTGSGATSDAIEAIYYAISNGATVINASWGGGGFSQALQDAIVDAYNAQVTFAAAAGNAHSNNDSVPTYPANYIVPNLISVAATKDDDTLASYSNFGKLTVQIASPGSGILSTLPNDSYAYSSGTSMATPMISGMIALMERELGHAINGYQSSTILYTVANNKNVGNITNKVTTDARMNVFKAVQHVKSNGVDAFQPDYTASAARGLASSGGAGGCGLVAKMLQKKDGGDSNDLFGRALLMLIVLTPFVLAIVMKQRRKDIEDRRSHERFTIQSEVRISLGERELVGSVSSISLGGVKINTEAMLEQGGIIEMNIMSPDGKERVQVLGKVVWSQERKAYGVQFCDMAETQSASISGWTKKLIKSS